MNIRKYNNIKAWSTLFFHRVCKALGLTVFVESRTGIKVLNRKTTHQQVIPSHDITLCPADVCLCYDGLKDKYTLAGTTVSESPHFNMIESILKGKDISLCDYVLRENRGALDGRFALRIDKDVLRMHINATLHSKQELESGQYQPPRVVSDGTKYYVLDGKHRMAMAAYLGIKEVRCLEISRTVIKESSYFQTLLRRMKKSPLSYSKNIAIMEPFLKK